MNTAHRIMTLAFVAACANTAAAQSVQTETRRDAVQQQRIEQGLQAGSLNTREAARLEAGAAHVDRVERRALSDGTLTPAEAARVRKAQNAQSAAIRGQKHDAQRADPAATSSKRMQVDVQRNANQQARIARGVSSGALTTRETASLEHGQARVATREAVAGIDGHVGPGGQATIRRAENAQSARIYNKQHNATTE